MVRKQTFDDGCPQACKVIAPRPEGAMVGSHRDQHSQSCPEGVYMQSAHEEASTRCQQARNQHMHMGFQRIWRYTETFMCHI